MTRRLLYIAFHFPPVRGSSGIQRTLKFVTYLREHAWESTVLTAAPRAYEQVSDDQMGEIPAGMQVQRAFALNTAKHLAFKGRFVGWMAQPDRWVSWWPAAVWRGLSTIRRQRPDAIVSTSPIPTAHLIGMTLARISGLPWVADCRDSLTEPGYPRDALTWRTNRWLESAMVRHCTRAVFTTEGTLRMYAERYPEVPAGRWAVIENGFDEENFREAERGFVAPAAGARPRITLLHSGILYPQERDPSAFFEALGRLKASGRIDSAALRVVLRATGSDDQYRSQLAAAGIDDIVELAPPMSYRAALQEMLAADGLLLFQASICNHQIPAKLYEYFRAGRPILTLTDPSGNTADAVRAAGADDIVNLTDAADIAAGLDRFIAGIRSGSTRGVAPDVAGRNSRRSRAGEFARLLDGMTAR
jgi:glycosyltransferase involved in cell wall biosynthesis